MAQHLRRFVPVVAGLALVFAPESALPQIWQTNSPTGATLYAFKGAPDGSGPAATLLVDKRGMIFGTTAGGGTSKACLGGCGTVFTLTPHGSDYVETTIYSFGGASNHDGEFPLGGLTEDASGALYGTTEFQGGGSGCQGLGCGIVYKLTPTRTGYAESVLYVFAGGADGEDPTGNVIIDAAGALYGTTVGGGYKEARCAPVTCGTVFKLTPAPGGGYTERVIHRFKGGKDGGLPYGALIADAKGALFGTTSTGGGGCSEFTCGTVFKLTPAGALGRSGYRKTTLHAFRSGANDGAQPLAGLVADRRRLAVRHDALRRRHPVCGECRLRHGVQTDRGGRRLHGIGDLRLPALDGAQRRHLPAVASRRRPRRNGLRHDAVGRLGAARRRRHRVLADAAAFGGLW